MSPSNKELENELKNMKSLMEKLTVKANQTGTGVITVSEGVSGKTLDPNTINDAKLAERCVVKSNGKKGFTIDISENSLTNPLDIRINGNDVPYIARLANFGRGIPIEVEGKEYRLKLSLTKFRQRAQVANQSGIKI